MHNLRNQTVCKNWNIWAIVSSLNQISNFSSNFHKWQFISKVCRAWYIFLSTTWNSLSLVITLPNGKSKLGADFFLQWFEIYGYTQFERRRTLGCEFFFTLKLWHDKVFNRHVSAINHPVIIWLPKLTAQTQELKFNTPLIRLMGVRKVSSCKYENH